MSAKSGATVIKFFKRIEWQDERARAYASRHAAKHPPRKAHDTYIRVNPFDVLVIVHPAHS